MSSPTRFHQGLAALPRSLTEKLSDALKANRDDQTFNTHEHWLALSSGPPECA